MIIQILKKIKKDIFINYVKALEYYLENKDNYQILLQNTVNNHFNSFINVDDRGEVKAYFIKKLGISG
jgi:hypothetical protein